MKETDENIQKLKSFNYLAGTLKAQLYSPSSQRISIILPVWKWIEYYVGSIDLRNYYNVLEKKKLEIF